MHFLVKLLTLACVVVYFDKASGRFLERWIEIEQDYVETISGEFEDMLKRLCTYREIRPKKGGKGPRTFSVDCKASTTTTATAVQCEYKGNPHNCEWYNKKHQPQFYERMAKFVKVLPNGACSTAQIQLPKKCTHIIFRKQ